MNSTYTIQQSLNWASIFVDLQPLTGVGGFSNEPALTIANTVAQIMLGAPLKWRWNRNVLTANAVSGTPTVSLTVAGSGLACIEKAYLTGAANHELQIKQVLASDSTQSRPEFISPLQETAANSNISLTLFPTPDSNYSLTVIGQNAPVLFTSLASTWSPIPDYMGHIYNTGFLAFAMLYARHAGFQLMFSRFLASLAGAAEGLSEQERSIFLGQYQYLLEATRAESNLQTLGTKGRFSVQI